MSTAKDLQTHELPPSMTHAEATAAIAVSSALARIRAGKYELAIEPLQHALNVLAEPRGAVEEIVRDAERFREFAEATVRDDEQFESAVIGFPPKDDKTPTLQYFRALVDFATNAQCAQFTHKGMVS